MADQNLHNLLTTLRGIFIFTADIVPTDEPAYKGVGWRSGRGLEADKTGPVFSYERVLAAAALYRMNPQLVLVPSGGKTNVDGVGESPPISSIVSVELQMLGVPATSIIEEPKAFNTWEQVEHCSALARKAGWSLDDCAILAPLWQMGRIAEMLTHGSSVRDVNPFDVGVTPLISMERTLAAEDPGKWNEYFMELYAAAAFKVTLAREAMGTGQLLTGHQPMYPNPFRGFPDPLSV